MRFPIALVTTLAALPAVAFACGGGDGPAAKTRAARDQAEHEIDRAGQQDPGEDGRDAVVEHAPRVASEEGCHNH